MNLNNFLSTIAFLFLFLLMLLYWSQAAFSSRERYKIVNDFVSLVAVLSLSLLLLGRWIESGHFPLSNLYESLLFLSLCFSSFLLLSYPPSFLERFSSGYGNSPVTPAPLSLPFPEGAPPERFGKEMTCAPTEQNEPQDNATSNQGFDLAKAFSLSSVTTGANRRFAIALSTPFTCPDGARVSLAKAEPKPLYCEAKRFAMQGQLGLGVILSPLSLLTYGFALFSLPKEMQQSTALVPALQSNWLMMHVTVMILSYAALLLGSMLSIAYLMVKSFLGVVGVPLLSTRDFALQNVDLEPPLHYDSSCTPSVQVSGALLYRFLFLPRKIKKQVVFLFLQSKIKGHAQQSTGTGDLDGTPIVDLQNTATENLQLHSKTLLSRLDNLSYRILSLGFPLLTIGILSGAVWANEAWGRYWSWDPKETWAFITWLVFAIYLHTRITKGWSGEKPAQVASFGFFIVWFCYLGVNLLGKGLHSYGWFS